MSRRADPAEVRTRAAAGYLTPAAIVARYGRRYGFTIQWVRKLTTKWSPRIDHATRAVETFTIDGTTYPSVIDDGAHIWLLEAAVKQALKQRKDRTR